MSDDTMPGVATRFAKGQSGNPGGRSKAHAEFMAQMRQNAPAAIAALLAGLEDPRQAKGCAEVILAYAYGKPKQITEISGPDGGPIQLGVGVSGLLAAAMNTVDPEGADHNEPDEG